MNKNKYVVMYFKNFPFIGRNVSENFYITLNAS